MNRRKFLASVAAVAASPSVAALPTRPALSVLGETSCDFDIPAALLCIEEEYRDAIAAQPKYGITFVGTDAAVIMWAADGYQDALSDIKSLRGWRE